MNDIAITVKGLSKSYRMYPSPKERMKELLHPFGKKYHQDFWALRDVSFEVRKGESIGIIGRNGSGKSTLLQILCGILQPTIGEVKVNGRVSALLELGAGFNRDFTGRENVYMSGAIMGFTKAEMDERFEAIAEFADIGDFIEQPVKTYSSGMYVRLAFAAAINVDPDILIVDEALAVGDARFQHKCYQKFIEFQGVGKTILLVTHNTSDVVKHCDSAILLENGSIIKNGNPDEVVNSYLEILFTGGLSSDEKPTSDNSKLPDDNSDKSTRRQNQSLLMKFLEEVPASDNCIYRSSYNKNEYRFGDNDATIIDYLVVCGENYDPVTIYSGDMIDIYVKAKFHQPVDIPIFGFTIKTVDGVVVYGCNTDLINATIHPVEKDSIVIFKFSLKLNLCHGDYFVDLGVARKPPSEHKLMDIRYSLFNFSVGAKKRFCGMVDLESTCQEVSRIVVS